ELAGKPGFAEDYRLARRDAAVLEAEAAMRRGEPERAVERYGAALRFEPGLTVAADGIRQAKHAAADAAHRAAQDHADRGDLDAARERLEHALGHVPEHPAATAARRSLSLPLNESPPPHRRAVAAAGAGAWDDALAGYRDAVVAAPDFLPARAAIPATLDAAAEDFLARGQTVREAGRLDDAEAALTRVLDYRPKHPALEAERGRVDLARGDRHLADDRPGAAWVAYRDALDHAERTPKLGRDAAQRGIAAAVGEVRDRHRVTLRVLPATGGSADLNEPLAERVRGRLAADAAAALALGPGGRAVTIDAFALDLPPATAHRAERSHPYTVKIDVPNPELPRLQHEIARVDHCIDDLLCDLRRLEHRHAYLHRLHTGEPGCGYTQELHAVNRKLRRIRRELRDARADHRRLTRRLVHEPTFVTKRQTRHWPFTLVTHRRRANLKAIAGFDNAANELPPVVAEVTETDTSIEGARPDLGLSADPLELPDDPETVNDLLDLAARELSRQIARDVSKRRDAALASEAKRLAESDPAAAREAEIARRILD
ncbi:MAG: hypothetical protein AAF710_11495, partial [Planctomycetota bacterium]